MDFKNLLIFRIGHLGDTVIALPAFWAIRDAFPNARITLLTNIDLKNPHYISPRNVLPETGLIDDWISYPTNLNSVEKSLHMVKLLLKIRRGRYDALIYLMPRMRSRDQIERDRKFFQNTGIHSLLGMDYLSQNNLGTDIPKPVQSVVSEADFLMDLLSNSGISIDISNKKTDLLLVDSEITAATILLESKGAEHAGKNIIAIAPGTKWESKEWSEGRFADVVGRLIDQDNCYPIIFGGSEDRAKGDRLIAHWGTGLNSAGSLTVRESAALLSKCTLYLGNDTGTMHLAAAVKIPCVAIFAAIDWRGRWHPFGTRNRIFRETVECEGCNTPNCFNDHKCLNLIGADDVYLACKAMLQD